MSILFLIFGIACILYFFLLLLYSGFTSNFYLIWPLMSVGFFVISYLFRIHFLQNLPLPVRVVGLSFTAFCLLFFLIVEGMIFKGSVQMPSSSQDYVIVLGAHVHSTGPSRALALRLNKALEYAKENPDTIFIVSGGQGSNEAYTEASIMKQYLVEHGLDAARILEEENSTNTRENLLFSKEFIPDNASIGIISNGFHICRALHLAEVLGLENVSGIPAKNDALTQPANLLREFFAVVKDFWIL